MITVSFQRKFPTFVCFCGANQKSTRPMTHCFPIGTLICTSVIFNHNSRAANHIRGRACWIILSDPIACSRVAINYNFGTQLICSRAGLVIWFWARSLDFPYPLISFALAYQQHRHMLSHSHPRAHLSSALLIPRVVASARLTRSQHAGCHSHSEPSQPASLLQWFGTS